MVFRYHQHQESEESRLTQPCSVCKIQNQTSSAPNQNVPAQIGEPLIIGKVFNHVTILRDAEVTFVPSPRAPPVSC